MVTVMMVILFIFFFIVWLAVNFSMDWIVFSISRFLAQLLIGGLIFAAIMTAISLYFWYITTGIIAVAGIIFAILAKGTKRFVIIGACVVMIVLIIISGIIARIDVDGNALQIDVLQENVIADSQ